MKKHYKQAAYDEAALLRKRGFTYDEIAKIVRVSKSTVSNWFSSQKWSQKVTEDNKKRAARDNSKRISLLNKARSNQNKKLYREAERSAEIEFKHYKHSPLFIAGLSLYVASGDLHDPVRIRLTTTNPDEHRIFIKFLMEFCGLEKKQIKFWLFLSSRTKEKKQEREWSKHIRLPITQFGKTQYLANKTSSLHRGSGNTIVDSVLIKKRLSIWVTLLMKDL